jgi:very-short-patch-repair endonuclease
MQQTDLTKAIARARRRQPPLAECPLWDAPRNRRFLGLKVRRQVPLCGIVVGFYIADRRLADDPDPLADPAALARIAAVCRQRIDPPGPI